MLIDLLRKNLKVTQNPIPIVKHPHKPPLTSSTELNQMYFAKGAMFRRMYGIAGLPIAFLFITKGLITKRYNVYNLTPYKQIIIGFIKSPQQKKPSG